MSGIHTHSGPGGYLQYILYIITSLGFVRESFDVLVGGIVEVRPHHGRMIYACLAGAWAPLKATSWVHALFFVLLNLQAPEIGCSQCSVHGGSPSCQWLCSCVRRAVF